MQKKPQRPSNRHHFIPEFLLKRWAEPTGELLRYWRTERGVCSKRRSPKAVCFEWGLYKTEGFPPEYAHQMETLFMGPLDSGAALAHAHLVERGEDGLSARQRSDWGRFIISLWFRTPLDLAHLGSAVSALADAAASKAILGIEVPAELTPTMVKQLQMEALREAINDLDKIKILINMDWAVLDVSNSRELWRSDWPLGLPTHAPWLGAADSFITVPIAPSKLFVAAGSNWRLKQFQALSHRKLILGQNMSTVPRAINFVGATNDNAKDFITRHFGTAERPSIMRPIADKYRQYIPR